MQQISNRAKYFIQQLMKLLFLFSGCVLFLFQFSLAQQVTQEEVLSFDSSKGILISLQEVAEIKELAKKGIEPHTSNVQLFLEFINDLIDSSQTWEKLEGEVVIFDRSASDPLQLSSLGGKLAYGTALAWHLTGDEKYAELCRQQILNLSKTYGFRNADDTQEVAHTSYMSVFGGATNGRTIAGGRIWKRGYSNAPKPASSSISPIWDICCPRSMRKV